MKLSVGRFVVIFLVALLWTAPAHAQNFDIVVAFGQSNSAQFGEGPYSDPLQTPAIDARIFMFGRFGGHAFRILPALQSFGGQPVECIEHWRANPCSTSTDKHGFIVAFARRYAQIRLAPGRQVLILSAGLVGTTVEEWTGKRIAHPEAPLLYSDMIGRLRYLLSIEGNRLVSLHLSQGEGDVNLVKAGQMTPARYEAQLRALLSKLRGEFLDTPLLATGFAPGWIPGDAVKRRIEDKVKHVVTELGGAFVATDGLQSNPGTDPQSDPAAHFSAQSMRLLGQRHFSAWRLLAD